MKREKFDTKLRPLGLEVSEYGGTCYFAESLCCSVILAPLRTEEIQRATIAVRTRSATDRNVMVNTFLDAAGVSRTPDIADALNGREQRIWTDEKCVTVAILDDEYIVTVATQ